MSGVALSFSNNDLSPSSEAMDIEPSSGATFFHAEYKKHGDLREMLDSSKDSLKLDAMKRIISMVAKGRDVSDLFPAVVKNVASKNIEVKKLVYVYLTRYAEEQQDLALLSISTFQRALKDPNQLIRASALRVLSSIRVQMIAPIMLLAIKESAVDMSPFVRKTAAHAIPKLFSLDPDMKDELTGVLEKLLGDRTTLVIGSAVMAFEEVCPDMIELIHKNYRKLVSLLVDVEEWGQVVILNMLTRYARTQFLDPNQGLPDIVSEKEFYENSDDEEEVMVDLSTTDIKPVYKMDADHRLLLRSTKPLLQSRNASVVMATAQLYWHLAPRTEVFVVAKSLARLLRSHNEVQSVVLNCIASMTIKGTGSGAKMFEPFLRQFFVRSSDPSHVKILKLEILTNLATQTNISVLLREFQSYISGADNMAVAATIQAIGRCAATIPEVTETCLSGLVSLLASKEQAVVAESVVEIKKLLQTQQSEHKDIISQMAKLLDTVEVGSARAAILWVVGEFSERIPNIAPDVLRKMAKSFCSEEDQVKQQVVNLAVKLYLTNPAQTTLLTQYVLNLAKYDMNYDIRDRTRLIRAIIFPQGEPGKISKHAKKIFLSSKPPPRIESKFANRDEYQLGSLSHYINARATGYHELPDFPETAPDPEVRAVEVPKPVETTKLEDKSERKSKSYRGKTDRSSTNNFYDSDGSNKMIGNRSEESEDSSSDSDSSDSDSSEESDESVKAPAKPVVTKNVKTTTKPPPKVLIKQDSESSESESSEDEEVDTTKLPTTKTVKNKPDPIPMKSNLDLLLDLEDIPPMMPTPTLTPSFGGFLTPSIDLPSISPTIGQPMFISSTSQELINKLVTGGVQVDYRFTRSQHIYSPNMVSIELTFSNFSSEEVAEIKLGSRTLQGGMSLHEFPAFLNLQVGQSRSVTLGVDYNDTTQAARLDLVIGGRAHPVTLNCPTGEMMRPLVMPPLAFQEEKVKLSGMNEVTSGVNLTSSACDIKTVTDRIYQSANMLQVPGDDPDLLLFAGRTVSSGSLVLLSFDLASSSIIVNTEKIVLGNMLVKELKMVLEK